MEKKVVKLSIKYQMDLMSMSMEDVKNLITNEVKDFSIEVLLEHK